MTLLEAIRETGVLVGRVLLSTIFLLSGLGKLADLSGTSAMMAHQGMPAVHFFLAMAILFELAGGLSILFGIFGRLGAFALFVYLIPVTMVFHDFWDYEGQARAMQLVNFLKNLAIMGGLLQMAGHGSGCFSIDGLRRRRS